MKLVNAHVFDMASGRFARRDLEIVGDRIGASDDGRVVDLAGAWLLPGFFDCHVHLTLDTGKANANDVWHNALPGAIALHTARMARRTLMCGITTVREVGGWDYHEIAVRNAINAGEMVGPRIFACGRILSQTCATTPWYPGMYRECDGPAEVRKAAREQIAKGADLIKMMVTGAITSAASENAEHIQFRPDEIRAAVEIANDNGLHVAAHAHGARGVINAATCGCRSVEHSIYGTREAYQAMIDHGTWLVPTLCVHQAMFSEPGFAETAPPHIRERYASTHDRHIANVALAYRMGVRIAMGTDAGTPGNHAGQNMQEVEVMVREAGMTPVDAIRAATLSPAEMLGVADRLGSLEHGKIADVIACPRNPLEDISALREVFFVMKDGRIHRNDRAFRAEPDGLVITTPVDAPL